MSSSVINFKTPIQTLLEYYPSLHLLHNIPLKIFGCSAFVHVHSQHRGKLDPRSLKCIFLGYSPNQKGYKCYSPVLKKFFTTMDVTFFETEPFFSNSSIQKEYFQHDGDDPPYWEGIHNHFLGSPPIPSASAPSPDPISPDPQSEPNPHQRLAPLHVYSRRRPHPPRQDLVHQPALDSPPLPDPKKTQTKV
ncbi:hypothetical protein F511_16748 [Dorcoceras hygrometricum]|uniref:Retroviral polymerase SH3-like domain-containing protein n=1 Tax=Dorcoceras hygrometricum TaxID=472368 RepID=A0A2Z7B332_9LAMI|nr:hypothetical protein F511_16748 [Dorcoceras hygrometricum]